ncbi:bacterial proteasome activator family protein [Nakamurella sp.]|uniref:bacterial proteasome activator family protein n=1 Tax=Nakamurella sp. TaxID=1869182 RepID=UPI003784A329
MSEAQGQRVVVIGPDGQPVGYADVPGAGGQPGGDDGRADGDGPVDPADAIGEPAKVMRIGTMIKQLLEEVRAAPLDEASRARLMQVHQRSIKELETGLTPDLRDELERLSLPFTEDTVPSEGELRIAQAQLVGWLEGVFHGLQAALVAQQMAARSQLEQMRRGLPPGHSGAEVPGGAGPGSGQYL